MLHALKDFECTKSRANRPNVPNAKLLSKKYQLLPLCYEIHCKEKLLSPLRAAPEKLSILFNKLPKQRGWFATA